MRETACRPDWDIRPGASESHQQHRQRFEMNNAWQPITTVPKNDDRVLVASGTWTAGIDSVCHKRFLAWSYGTRPSGSSATMRGRDL